MPALRQRGKTERERLTAADEIECGRDAAAGRLYEFTRGAGFARVDGGRSARLERERPLRAIGLGHDRSRAEDVSRHPHGRKSDTAGADHQRRCVRVKRRRFAQRAERRETRTGERARLRLRQRREVEEITRVLDQHVVREAAVAIHAQRARRAAKMLVAAGACAARTAADPREHDPAIADRNTARIWAERDHLADDLVAEDAGRGDAAREFDATTVAEIEKAVREVDVAVADAACLGPQQHLPAGRGRRRGAGRHQWHAERLESKAAHGGVFAPLVVGPPARMVKWPVAPARVTPAAGVFTRGGDGCPTFVGGLVERTSWPKELSGRSVSLFPPGRRRLRRPSVLRWAPIRSTSWTSVSSTTTGRRPKKASSSRSRSRSSKIGRSRSSRRRRRRRF